MTKDFEKDFNLPVTVLNDLFQGAFLISLYRSRNLTRFIDPFLIYFLIVKYYKIFEVIIKNILIIFKELC